MCPVVILDPVSDLVSQLGWSPQRWLGAEAKYEGEAIEDA
jgi:hypothetical protein